MVLISPSLRLYLSPVAIPGRSFPPAAKAPSHSAACASRSWVLQKAKRTNRRWRIGIVDIKVSCFTATVLCNRWSLLRRSHT